MSPNRKTWLIAGGAVAALAVVGLGATLLMPAERLAAVTGDVMRIALVQPAEAAPVEGEVMEVGEVVDGYVHVEPPPPMEFEPVVFDWSDSEPAWTPPEPPPYVPPPEPVRVITSAPPPEAAPTRAPHPLAFGLDQPRPDYAAERRERQARMEAMQAAPRPVAAGPEVFY